MEIIANELCRSVLLRLVCDGVLAEHVTDWRLAGFSDEVTVAEEKTLVDSIKNHDKEHTITILKKITSLKDHEFDKEASWLHTITPREILFYYYLKDELTEEELLLLQAYEKLMSLNPEDKEQLNNDLKDIAECIVTKIEYAVNEHAIRVLKDETFDILSKKLHCEDVYAEKDKAVSRHKYLILWDDRYMV